MDDSRPSKRAKLFHPPPPATRTVDLLAIDPQSQTAATRPVATATQRAVATVPQLAWSAKGGAPVPPPPTLPTLSSTQTSSSNSSSSSTQTSSSSRRSSSSSKPKVHPIPAALQALSSAIGETEALLYMVATLRRASAVPWLAATPVTTLPAQQDWLAATVTTARVLGRAALAVDDALARLAGDLAVQRSVWARIIHVRSVLAVVHAPTGPVSAFQVLLDYSWRVPFARSWPARLVPPGLSHPIHLGRRSKSQPAARPAQMVVTVQARSGEKGVYSRSLPVAGPAADVDVDDNDNADNNAPALLLDLHDGHFDTIMARVMRVQTLRRVDDPERIATRLTQDAVHHEGVGTPHVPRLSFALATPDSEPSTEPSAEPGSGSGEAAAPAVGLDAGLAYILAAKATLATLGAASERDSSDVLDAAAQPLAHIATVRALRAELAPLATLPFVTLTWAPLTAVTASLTLSFGPRGLTTHAKALVVAGATIDPPSFVTRVTSTLSSLIRDAIVVSAATAAACACSVPGAARSTPGPAAAASIPVSVAVTVSPPSITVSPPSITAYSGPGPVSWRPSSVLPPSFTAALATLTPQSQP